jgi:hypothetical protein
MGMGGCGFCGEITGRRLTIFCILGVIFGGGGGGVGVTCFTNSAVITGRCMIGMVVEGVCALSEKITNTVSSTTPIAIALPINRLSWSDL